MKIAVIETPSIKHGVTQAELVKEAAALGLEVVVLHPDAPTGEFRPEDYRLVVNRLSATAYERGPAVFATAYRWLAAAEKAGVPVLNGTRALEVDSSKAVQQRLLLKLRPTAPLLTSRTRLFRSLEEAQADSGEFFHDSPVFIKLAAGGSGTGTSDFSSFEALRQGVAQQDFGKLPDGRDRFSVFSGLLDLLRRNFEELERVSVGSGVVGERTTARQHAATGAVALQSRGVTQASIAPSRFELHEGQMGEFPLLVQEAVQHDPSEAVYRELLVSEGYRQSKRPPARWVLRVEVFGNKIGFGAWMATAGNNFCHADVCSRDDRAFETTWLAHRDCAIPPKVAQTSLEIAREARMQLAGIEWIRDEGGHWRVIDINGLSLYRTQPYDNDAHVVEARIRPWKVLAKYLSESVRPPR